MTTNKPTRRSAQTLSHHGPATPDASTFQTRQVLALGAAHCVHDIYTAFLSPLLPVLIERLSLSLAQAGFLTTVMQLPALMNPYLGSWADRGYGRYFVILAPAMTAVPMSLLGLAPSYAVLLLLLFGTGISVALFHVPSPVMVADCSGPQKGRGMSVYMTGGELARSIGPLIAAGWVSAFGMASFPAIMLFGLLTSTWLWLQFKVPVGTRITKTRASTWQVWREMHGLFLPLGAILCARGFMHAALAAFLPTFIQRQGGSLWAGGMALALYEIAGVCGILFAGRFSDRYGRRRVLALSLVGAPLALLLFGAVEGALRWPALFFTGALLLSTTPVMLTLVQEQAHRHPAAANGIFMMISFMARSAIVVVVGWIADRVGLSMTYAISACCGLAGLPFLLALPAKPKPLSPVDATTEAATQAPLEPPFQKESTK
jgi:MFS transporter, FSR family, fosmidomycin resistance protein